MALPLTPRRKVVRGHRCIESGLLSTLHRGQQFAGMHLLVGGMEAESGHAGSVPVHPISKRLGPVSNLQSSDEAARRAISMVNSGVDDLYQPVEPYDFGELEVGDGQTLYWETVGTPQGLPAVWLHGGPGSGSTADARRHFDPSAYRAVLFDQRGCGRSRPLVSGPGAKLTANT